MSARINKPFCAFAPAVRLSSIVLLLAGTVAAQDASRPVAAAGSFSGSLSNERDRAAERMLKSAQQRISGGDLAGAAQLLQEVIETGSESLVFSDDAYRNAKDAAEQTLLTGPGALHVVYVNVFGPIARHELQQAVLGDDHVRIRKVAWEYQHTPAGREAGLLLWAAATDRGDWESAREYRRRLSAASAGGGRAPYGGRLQDRLSRLTDAGWASGSQAGPRPEFPFPGTAALTEVRWAATVPMSEAARHEIAASLAELNAQAIVPLMSARPLVRGKVAYSRRLGSLIAVSVETGETLWERVVPCLASRLADNAHASVNPVRRSSATAVFLERFVRSSLSDRLSTDGMRVFAVIDEAADSTRNERRWNRRPHSPRNMLVALAAEDGRLLWRAGADFKIDGLSDAPAALPSSVDAMLPSVQRPDRALRDVFFLGTPTVFGDVRLAVGQQGDVVSLVALAAETGELVWSAPLGRTVRPLGEDAPRLGTSCPVMIHDGRAYCATAAGCVACVDLGAKTLLWAYRYPRSDLPKMADPEDRGRPDATHATHMPTQETWHEVFLAVADDCVLLASPDSNRLYALDARTGRLRWSEPRGRGLFMAGPHGDRILIVGNETATARAGDDGRELWTTNILRPAGRGIGTEAEYIFPAQDGGWQSVQWEDGTARLGPHEREDVRLADVGGRRFPITLGPPPRLRPVRMVNLVAAEDVVLAQSFHELTALTAGEERASPPTDRALLADGDDDDTSTSEREPISWPALSLDGEFSASAEFSIAVMRRAFPMGDLMLSTVHAVRELGPRLRAPDERAAELITRLASALRTDGQAYARSVEGEPVLARLLRQPINRLYVLLERPRRSVRLDRWFERGFAEAVLTDAASREQFAELWNSAAIRRVRTRDADDSARREKEDATQLPKRDGSWDMAHWPTERPEISVHPYDRGAIYVNTVPLSVTADSPWEFVTVQVDRQGEHVWFLRADGAAAGPIALPRSHASPRMVAEFLHAWANGPQLCLRVGTELFGFRISPADGLLPTTPAWPNRSEVLSIAGERPPFIAALTETSEDPRPLWDDSLPSYFDTFSRQFAAVGPVTAKYLCYQDRGHVVALDPATGRELWCRSDLPVGTRCLGDDEHVVLLREDSTSVEVLRSIDGKTIDQWDWRNVLDADQRGAAIFSHIVAVRGTLALWHTRPPQQRGGAAPFRPAAGGREPVSVAVIDLASGHRLWSRAVRPGSWALKLDNDRLGLLAPEGTLSIWDWETGASLAEHAVHVPPELTNVAVITDAQSSFVVASGRVDDLRLLHARQIRGAYRRPVVNGWMHAIERSSGRLLWQRPLDNIGLIVDQPRHVPLLVTSYTVNDEDRNRNTGVLLCIDRRTGETLHEHPSQSPYIYHTVQSDATAQRVDVVTQDTIIRFQFAPKP